jgi:hypothetical protein
VGGSGEVREAVGCRLSAIGYQLSAIGDGLEISLEDR